MSLIKERNSVLGTVYERYSTNNELIQKVGIVGFVKEFDGKYFFIIHDIMGNLIDDANFYLNNIISGAGYKKRELAFTALKLFYSFIHLFHIKEYKRNLSYENVQQLVRFLEGGSSKGIRLYIDFQTDRKNETVNIYLNVIRDYYRVIFRVENNSLFTKSTVSIHSGGGLLGHANKIVHEKYKVSKKVKKEKRTVPKYIKQHQFDKMIELIEKDYTLREKIIVMLMYQYGLRIGEVLGLTFEDVLSSKFGKPRIILRNRLSDKPYQSAKGLMTILSVKDYESRFYSTFGTGFKTIVVREEIIELINEYIDESRDTLLLSQSQKRRDNLKNKAKADRVGDIPLTNNENQYVFLNQQHYTPLTSTGWNYILRKIFKTLDIEVDTGVKQNNLSHRFRHGFAMNKVSEGYTVEMLAEALRHSTTSTCMVYYNPDEEDQSELLKINDYNFRERYRFD